MKRLVWNARWAGPSIEHWERIDCTGHQLYWVSCQVYWAPIVVSTIGYIVLREAPQ